MRIYLIAILAIMAGIVLGSASTIREFGYQSLNPWYSFTATSYDSMFDDGHTLAVALTPPPEGEAQPKARPESLSENFGTVEEGDWGELTYVIHNDGTAPLVLEKGKSSCKCAVSEITKSSVPPGESSEIVVKWRTQSATEKFHKRFAIKTNDRENAEISFSVIGKVLPVMKFLPRSISARTVVVGEPHEVEARFYYYRDQPLKIHSWRFNNRKTAEFFDLSYEPLSEEELAEQGAKSGYLCRIQIKPGLEAGSGNQELSVTTNARGKRPPRVNLYLEVHDAVSVFGTKVRSGWRWQDQSLELRRSDDSPYFAEELIIQAMGKDRAETEFKVKEVLPAELQVELGEDAEEFRGKALRTSLSVSLSDDVDAEAIFDALPEKRGRVVIETTHPEYPEIGFDVRLKASTKRTLTFETPRQVQDVAEEADKVEAAAAAKADENGKAAEASKSDNVDKSATRDEPREIDTTRELSKDDAE